MSAIYDTALFIATIQASVNQVQGGEDWIRRTRSDAMDQDLAIFDEMAEFRNSFIRFRWWGGDTEPVDLSNARMEIVDAFHFLLSAHIARYNGDLEVVARDVEMDATRVFSEGHRKAVSLNNAFKRFLVKALESRPAFWELFELCTYVDMDWTRLSSYYLGKAMLNKFRQANGYGDKPRTYKKVWQDGKEDNYYLMLHLDSILDAGQVPNTEGLIVWLADEYAKMRTTT